MQELNFLTHFCIYHIKFQLKSGKLDKTLCQSGKKEKTHTSSSGMKKWKKSALFTKEAFELLLPANMSQKISNIESGDEFEETSNEESF